MRTALLAIVFAVSLAAAGPKLAGLQSRPAGGPFVYEPPEGFVPFEGSKKPDGVKIWIEANATRPGAPVRVIVNQSDKNMSVDEGALAQLVGEMPSAFNDCAWTHRRHELRTRADGTHVGLIEGDCARSVEVGFGLPQQVLVERKLQMMFPDDGGTAIVTASYPTEQASRWEPLFEATIGKAQGVALRSLPPPSWSYAVWAVAGAVLGTFAGALGRRKNEKKKDDARAGGDPA